MRNVLPIYLFLSILPPQRLEHGKQTNIHIFLLFGSFYDFSFLFRLSGFTPLNPVHGGKSSMGASASFYLALRPALSAILFCYE